MQQAKAPHNPVQVHAETRQNKGAAQESPQGEHIAQLDAMVDASPAMAAQRKLIGMIHNSPAMAAQRKAIDGIHGNTPAQRAEAEQEEPATAQRAEVSAKPNHTGLPDNLKTGIESLSGLSMDNVKVHYNSSQPAQLNALAYAQGTDIHVAPGQEQHLPHEAWHVVQQAQGRVKPTMQMKDGVQVNDDTGLEREADVMGARAVQMSAKTKNVRSSLSSLDSPRFSLFQLAPMNSAGVYTAAALPPLAATPNTPSVAGTQPLSGSPTAAEIFVTTISASSAAADPNGFVHWRDYGGLGLLKEHSRNYNLTRLHAIRGIFHGPSSADNMILGTAASNNPHTNSHLNQVERPIGNFLTGTPNRYGVHYRVTPNFTAAPGYITARAAGITNLTDQANFLAWAPQACPVTFQCDATFYKTSGTSPTGYESLDQTTIQQTDL